MSRDSGGLTERDIAKNRAGAVQSSPRCGDALKTVTQVICPNRLPRLGDAVLRSHAMEPGDSLECLTIGLGAVVAGRAEVSGSSIFKLMRARGLQVLSLSPRCEPRPQGDATKTADQGGEQDAACRFSLRTPRSRSLPDKQRS